MSSRRRIEKGERGPENRMVVARLMLGFAEVSPFSPPFLVGLVLQENFRQSYKTFSICLIDFQISSLEILPHFSRSRS
jgi:hypothetical protein